MKQIIAVLCSPMGETVPAQIMHKITTGAVKVFTGGRYGHVAIVLEREGQLQTVEMIWPGITFTPGEKYHENNCYAFIQVPIPVSDEKFDEIQRALDDWKAKNIGYALWTGCVAAGAENVHPGLGAEIDEHWSKKFDTMMCSEMGATLIRIPYPDFCGLTPGGAIDPNNFLQGLMGLSDVLSGTQD